MTRTHETPIPRALANHLPWSAEDWTASDDRVRGGKSQSYIECSERIGCFHGDLDITALGGAGFASQRTRGEDTVWDLAAYAGIALDVEKADSKRYTFILKDELLPPSPDSGWEQSTISYEYDFTIEPKQSRSQAATVSIPWSALRATYRGKEKSDAPPPDLGKIKRMSIMMRRY
ncbi:hypothetical protein LTR66_005299 [Elasticomyces elasticus]|nr:hypothetical protein LTR50_000098 [Elasticomyces elasticus]KAK4994724.1 hypothetical protein LTR66_005299 [Elasticomyces elasticus]